MRTSTIPAITVAEDIQLFEHMAGQWVSVVVGVGEVKDGVFSFTVPQQFKTYNIQDNPPVINQMTGEITYAGTMHYTELMSANPSWAPNKPAGVFRQEDLWHFVDLIRSRG
jgi:hypothetical protein